MDGKARELNPRWVHRWVNSYSAVRFTQINIGSS